MFQTELQCSRLWCASESSSMVNNASYVAAHENFEEIECAVEACACTSVSIASAFWSSTARLKALIVSALCQDICFYSDSYLDKNNKCGKRYVFPYFWYAAPGGSTVFKCTLPQASGRMPVVPQTGLALLGSHGIAMVPWISPSLWSGAVAEPCPGYLC